jgi:D-glycero-D-manno-heptose 1,7-bisphosphate phosphatase
MLLQAAKEFNIDLKASWMIGDSGSDIKAGQVAGCHVAGVGRSPAASEEGVSWFQDLSSCVDFILGK